MERGHSTAKLTYSDYVRFPDDGLRHEIIGGEHYVTPSPATRHQRIVRTLLHLIQSYIDTHPVGEVFCAPFDALLSEFDVVVPDLLYLSKERARFLTSKNLQGPPDLVIEILSPSTKSRDRRLKRDLYERVGVREYWVIDPDRDVVEIHRHATGSFQPPTTNLCCQARCFDNASASGPRAAARSSARVKRDAWSVRPDQKVRLRD